MLDNSVLWGHVEDLLDFYDALPSSLFLEKLEGENLRSNSDLKCVVLRCSPFNGDFSDFEGQVVDIIRTVVKLDVFEKESSDIAVLGYVDDYFNHNELVGFWREIVSVGGVERTASYLWSVGITCYLNGRREEFRKRIESKMREVLDGVNKQFEKNFVFLRRVQSSFDRAVDAELIVEALNNDREVLSRIKYKEGYDFFRKKVLEIFRICLGRFEGKGYGGE